MPIVLIDFAFAAVIAAVGVIGGWWLRARGVRQKTKQAGEEGRFAREVLSRMHELAARVATDVGEHSSRVEEINAELTAGDVHETEVVVGAVDKLLAANNQMQQQLASAEERLREQEQEIESRAAEARTDALTGLANRRAFDDELARRLAEFQRHGRTFSVVMVDVDHFKKFNDKHGHQAGDEVLRGVGGVLRGNARQMDMAARYGGEEFTLVLPDTSVTDANPSADRVRQAIERAGFDFAGKQLHVTVSMGVAHLLADEEVATLIKRADAALYASKDAGRNCIHWHDGQTIHPVHEQPRIEEQDTPAEDSQPQEPEKETETPQAAAPPAAEAEPVESPEPKTDETTGLCNQAAFCTMLGGRLAEWRRGGAPPSVILVRIDGYPTIVSGHGQQAGDVAVRTTTRFLNAAVREMDLVASYDAQTFAVLLPGAGMAAVIGVAERLRQAIARCTLPVDADQLRFTISLGGAEAMTGDDIQKMLCRTEEALGAAITSGGNCSYFHNGQWSDSASAALESASPS